MTFICIKNNLILSNINNPKIQKSKTELGSPPPSPTDKRRSSNPTNEFAAHQTANKASDNKNFDSFEFLQSPIENTETSLLGRLWRAKATKKKFERNELKHSVLGNHYGYCTFAFNDKFNCRLLVTKGRNSN